MLSLRLRNGRSSGGGAEHIKDVAWPRFSRENTPVVLSRSGGAHIQLTTFKRSPQKPC